jgi:hypothetical protein
MCWFNGKKCCLSINNTCMLVCWNIFSFAWLKRSMMDIFCFEFYLQVSRWCMMLKIKNCSIFTKMWILNPQKKLKLSCLICKDEIKLETSTICGHIFCQECIYGMINTQNKCPICQKKLSSKNVHRVYI